VVRIPLVTADSRQSAVRLFYLATAPSSAYFNVF
jgi:hypothetical protein